MNWADVDNKSNDKYKKGESKPVTTFCRVLPRYGIASGGGGVFEQNEPLQEMLGKGKLHRRGESHSSGKYNCNTKSTPVNHAMCKTVEG